MGRDPRGSVIPQLTDYLAPIACVMLAVLVAAAPGVTVALFAIPVFALIAVRPEKSAFALIPLTPFYNMLILRLGNGIDLRALEFAWLAVGLGLLGKLAMRKVLRVGRLPRWLLISGTLWLIAQVVAATTSSLGVSAWVEAAQSAYLLLLGVVGAACVAGADSREVRRLRSHVLLSFLFVVTWSTVQMVTPALGAPQFVIAIPGGVSVVSALVKTQMAGEAITLHRFGLLNLGPVASAGYLVWILGGALSVVVHSSARMKRLEAAAALLAGIALLATFSRAGWLAGVAVVLVVVASAGYGRAFLGSVILATSLLAVSLTPWVSARASELTDVNEGSFADHLQMWNTAAGMSATSPFTGWGPGAFKLTARAHGYYGPSGDPHNYVLQEAAESGLLGALAVVALSLGGGLWAAKRLNRYDPQSFGLAVGVLAMFAICLTQNGFRTELTWAPYAMTIGLAMRSHGPVVLAGAIPRPSGMTHGERRTCSGVFDSGALVSPGEEGV